MKKLKKDADLKKELEPLFCDAVEAMLQLQSIVPRHFNKDQVRRYRQALNAGEYADINLLLPYISPKGYKSNKNDMILCTFAVCAQIVLTYMELRGKLKVEEREFKTKYLRRLIKHLARIGQMGFDKLETGGDLEHGFMLRRKL